MRESDARTRFTFAPFPDDRLVYKGEALVEYRTPPETDGLGTYSWLRRSALPVAGAAMLAGVQSREPDLVLLSVRLPSSLEGLTATLIRQFERDAARCPSD
jgi:hypothetical protein